MSKSIRHESFRYCFLKAANSYDAVNQIDSSLKWHNFISNLSFEFSSKEIFICWLKPHSSEITFSVNDAHFYKKRKSYNLNNHMDEIIDKIKSQNEIFFKYAVKKVAKAAGFVSNGSEVGSVEDAKSVERDFHDEWANSEDAINIDVIKNNEVCTAPEMRYITKKLGVLTNKTLLDIGCGLGEASVYFAMRGASVTASDLSQGMLDVTAKLAEMNSVSVKQHLADAEDLMLKSEQKFDIIYAGNLLHHVDINKMLMNVKPHLNAGGIFVSWDPIAYNPMINIYRYLAMDVRTPEEHPLKLSDILLFDKHFNRVDKKYFWFFTLIIFVIMAIFQRRNPNKERFWKVILEEGDKWRWLYRPLEKLDSAILFLFPPLRLLCWNIVIIGRNN